MGELLRKGTPRMPKQGRNDSSVGTSRDTRLGDRAKQGGLPQENNGNVLGHRNPWDASGCWITRAERHDYDE